MFLVFLRHGSIAALLIAVAVEVVAVLLGRITLMPTLVLLGALMF